MLIFFGIVLLDIIGVVLVKMYAFWKSSAVSAHFRRKQKPGGNMRAAASVCSRLCGRSRGITAQLSNDTFHHEGVSFHVKPWQKSAGAADVLEKSGTNIQINPIWNLPGKTAAQTGNIGLIFPELSFKMDRVGV